MQPWRLLICVLFVWLTAAQDAHAREPRLVFAHYMVCCPRVGYTPTVDDFLTEIREAHAAGIDGFVLNCGEWKEGGRYQKFSALLFEAARRFGVSFKLFFSADQVTAAEAADMVVRYKDHPSQFIFDHRPVLSSYLGSGEWIQKIRVEVRDRANTEVFVIPYIADLSVKSRLYAAFSGNAWERDVDGFFYFGAGGNHDDLAAEIRSRATKWSRQGKVFMAGIAPYYRGLRNNYIVYENLGYEGLVKQWTAAIESETRWVELVTWNDWGEATYFSPLAADLPASRRTSEWGELLSHDGFLAASSYFIAWFKSGKPPIESERLFYAYRLHPKDVVGRPFPTEPGVESPKGAGALRDGVHVIAFLKEPAELIVSIGGAIERKMLPAGVSVSSTPSRVGEVRFELIRTGQVIGSKAGEFPITGEAWGNFNELTGNVPIHSP